MGQVVSFILSPLCTDILESGDLIPEVVGEDWVSGLKKFPQVILICSTGLNGSRTWDLEHPAIFPSRQEPFLYLGPSLYFVISGTGTHGVLEQPALFVRCLALVPSAVICVLGFRGMRAPVRSRRTVPLRVTRSLRV